ncbi:MAG: histidine phosphatase family protein [Chitinophagaceae bacterium]|nr:histidine phosphatase family protein [Chitinophagaceae bacterium]
MKTILLVRHAKSSWENFSVDDRERPLNPRGKRDAPEMARRLLKKNILIDAFLSSPALRAKTTAEYFAEEYEMNKNKIIIVPELYMANNEAFINTIRHAPADADIIAIFSHNNGITEFANTLTDTRIDHMPTCSVFAITADIRSWSDFKPGANRFFFFEQPKKP